MDKEKPKTTRKLAKLVNSKSISPKLPFRCYFNLKNNQIIGPIRVKIRPILKVEKMFVYYVSGLTIAVAARF